MKKKNKLIAVAMSGGVDSSLAAALLKNEGYSVFGITIRTWPKEECGQSFGRACCNLDSVTRARAVANQLGIPYYVVDFSAHFKKEVIDYFCAEYLLGMTPNPCVICNQRLKFGKLLDKAISLGAQTIATGHFANVSRDEESGRFLLKEGADKLKDQSYFLFMLSQEQLARSVFPLGDFTKERVRSAAKRLKLHTYDTASSQDVCFVQDDGYAEYIKKKTGVEIRTGEIVDTHGKVLGSHKGIPYYTIGQRRGLGIAHGQPLYVTSIDVAHNRIVVGEKKAVMKKSVIVNRINWIAVEKLDKPVTAMVKIRYNHAKARAEICPSGEGSVRIDFDQPQAAPTPGQAAVFYDNDIVLGGGWIKEAS